MVDTQFKASKQRGKNRRRVAEDPLRGHDNSSALSSGENSVGHPLALQFITLEQSREAFKQVQQAMIQGVWEKMKALER